MPPDKTPNRQPTSRLTATAASAQSNAITPPAPALALTGGNATATPVVTAAVAAMAALAAVTLVVLAGCSSAAKDCTARLPTSGPPAQSFISVLHSLEQAGLVVQSVSATGTVTLAPNHHCRPPPKQTLDALRSKAVQALTDRDYAESGCGVPPIVIAQACLK